MWNCDPFLFRNIERVVILEDIIAVSSEDDYFVAVGDHIVEGSAFGEGLFGFGGGELDAEFGEGVVVFASTVALMHGCLPPKI